MRTKLGILVLAACITSGVAMADEMYREPLRPQFHFSPPQRWMNDPNGMVFHAGEYHLFYQYNPYGNTWGPMHWGHAISPDMVHWENFPIALFPDRHGAMFSGSAVVDQNNTSGLGTEGNPAMVALFTYHDAIAESAGRKDFQAQGMAYSLDKGRTWVKFAGNPVLPNPGIQDFRDPKVSWFEPQKKWIMTLAVSDHVSFYSSKDLKTWTHESDFGEQWGGHGGVWECPDLIEMPVEGEGTKKTVLVVSLNPGGPNGGSGTQYFVGHFDGHAFTLDREFQKRLAITPSAQRMGSAFDPFSDVQWKASGNAFAAEAALRPPLSIRSSKDIPDATGVLRSRPFKIEKRNINFQIGGGRYPGIAGMQLLVDDVVVRTETGRNNDLAEHPVTVNWDVSAWIGKSATLEIVDGVGGDWGYTEVSDIRFSDKPASIKPVIAAWLDYGTDNYAGVSWAGVPRSDGRTLMVGWMNNWEYAQKLPTEGWRGAMTLPRELKLSRGKQGLELISVPVKELQVLRAERVELASGPIGEPIELLDQLNARSSGQFELNIDVDLRGTKALDLVLSSKAGEKTTFRIDRSSGQYKLDRSLSGVTKFSHPFNAIQTAPMADAGKKISLQIFVDRSSIEIFVDGGRTVFTSLLFPTAVYDSAVLSADGETTLLSAQAYELRSIWAGTSR